MNKFMDTLRVVIVMFAIITAVLLAAWVLDLVNSEEVKDNLVKVAALTGIITAVLGVIQIAGTPKN